MSLSSGKHTKVILSWAFPDFMIKNIFLRDYIAEGFSNILGKEQVVTLPIEVVPARVRNWRPELTLILGHWLHDSCDYTELRYACDQTGSILAFWVSEDPSNFDSNVKILKIADYIFSRDRWASEHYHREKVFHLLEGASPTAHSPQVSISETQMQRDVFFGGGGVFKPREDSKRLIQDFNQGEN